MIVDSHDSIRVDRMIADFHDNINTIIYDSWNVHNKELSSSIELLKKHSLISVHDEELLLRCVSSVHAEYSSVHRFYELYSFFRALSMVNNLSDMSNVPLYDFIMIYYCHKYPRRFFFLGNYKIEDFLLRGLSSWGNMRSVIIVLSILVSLSPHRIINYDDWTMIVDSISSVNDDSDVLHISLIVETVCSQVLAKDSYAYYHKIDLGIVKLLLIADKLSN